MPQQSRVQKPLTVQEALAKLTKCSKNLKKIGRLNKYQIRQVEGAIDILKETKSSFKHDNFRLFLQQLMKHVGKGKPVPVLTMLCAVGICQSNIANMNMAARTMLLSELTRLSQQFDDPILLSLALRHGLDFSSNSSEMEQSQTNGRQIQFAFSRAPAKSIPLLDTLISDAIQTSRQWKAERESKDPRTECLTTLIPRDQNEDISITLWVGQQAGMQLLNKLDLQPTWSSLHGHQSL